jgi:regulator of replication initiation timing
MDNGGIWPGDESYFQNIRETALQDTIEQLTKELAEARAENAALVAEFQRLADEPPTLEEIAADLDKIEMLEKQLAEAQTEVDRWKGECSDLVRMAHEMRAEIDYFQTLIDLQHKRTAEADKLWQQAHNQPGVLPDLGRLIEWLMKRRADDMRCCYNCKYGPMCSVDARVCSGCSFAHNTPADGQMRWEAKP